MGVTNFDKINLDKEAAIATTNVAAVTAASASTAISADYTQEEVQAIATLANANKVALNLAIALLNETKAKLNAICKG